MRFKITCGFLAPLLCAQAQTVVPNGLLFDGGSPPFPSSPGQYSLTVYQDVAQTDYTSIVFDYTAPDLIFRNANIDEGSDWYFVTAGQNFTLGGAKAGDFTSFSGFNQSYPITQGDFYLAVTTGLGFTGAEPNRSVVGWGLFQSSPSGITLLDSAVAYDASAIEIGTSLATAIPEPSTYAMAAALAAGLAATLRRRRRRPATVRLA